MSLKEIAQRVGVSVSTVSRVLNGKGEGYASPQVQQAVLEAARELNYRPNLYARSLQAGQAPEKGLTLSIVVTRGPESNSDPFFQSWGQRLEAEILAAGCQVGRTIWSEEWSGRLPQEDGLLLLGRCREELLKGFFQETDNLVGVWRNPVAQRVDQVVCSGEKAARVAMEYLLELGHRKIAYMGDCSYENRFIGYSKALMERQIPLVYPLIYDIRQTRQNGFEAMTRLLQQGTATAVLCANDELALGALDAQRQRKGGAVPLSVISIDDTPAARAVGLTAVHIPGGEMSHLAVNLLIDRLRGGHQEPARVELPCRLVERESCFCLAR